MDNKTTDQFQKARSEIIKGISTEFVGPVNGDSETISENPVTRYAAGMIFPVDYESRMDNDSKDRLLDGDNGPVASDDAPGDLLDKASANSFFPSVMGLSFYCTGKNSKLDITIKWTTYKKLEHGEYSVKTGTIPDSINGLVEFGENMETRDGRLFSKGVVDYKTAKLLSDNTDDKELQFKFYELAKLSQQGAWTNSNQTKNVALSEPGSVKVADGLELVCEIKEGVKDGPGFYNVALKNIHPACANGMDEEHVFFNVSMEISSHEGNEKIFAEYSTPPLFKHDDEEKSLALLYRNRKTFAVGHGCSANWKYGEDSGFAESVFTETLPMFEVPRTDFDIPGLDVTILGMKNLAGEGKPGNSEIIERLKNFCKLYLNWIEGLSSSPGLEGEFLDTARKHINLCHESYSRMVEGVNILEKDSVAMRAFQLANKAMYIQSLHTDLQKKKHLPGSVIEWPDYNHDKAFDKKWRPFQLGFLLLSLKGIVDPGSSDRNIVDLVWFPTGGGKTEAYLGLSAFTIFYRRLKNKKGKEGTSVIMRYTLRLLTSQQFQRACTLVCAMEKIRKDTQTLGVGEISIGLWVGMESTPNSLDTAESDFRSYILGDTEKNPSPLLSCPWCGTAMVIEHENGRREYGYKGKLRPKRANLYCLEKTCPFNDRLPILIVDEEIYRDPPTLLFGTVDKFAQMPLQKGVSRIFAADNDSLSAPPELIIQDELHLISGALGTLVGLYETAIDFLCSRKGTPPKIVTSTATIRRADEQCKNLFNRESRQFPAPGISVDDSFFSREVPLEKSPGRLYLGIMPSGKTQTTASVRLSAKLLYSVFTLKTEDEVRDKYWTLVSYFNSIRELGGFISLTTDDIPMYMNAFRQRYGGEMRHIFVPKELTSRKRAEEIPEILEQLSVGYPDRRAIDVLAATNMLSVGIDIDRFGLMVIRGQPKLTSEYIQVSSRIGRKYPGLVVTLYNPARTRDRAHYERFRTYHESFYRNVEPSSVTPFSAPARGRALGPVLVSMFRHGFDTKFEDENGAALVDANPEDLEIVRDFVASRVKNIDKDEADETLNEIGDRLGQWSRFVKENDGNVVYKNGKQGMPVSRSQGNLGKGLWVFPTSMRNVDTECNIEINDE